MARELKVGAHLRGDDVKPDELEVAGGTLEQITKLMAIPMITSLSRPTLAHAGSRTLAYGDLLPIQPRVRTDEEMGCSATSVLPTTLAAKRWNTRTDASVGDDPWKPGSGGSRADVTASDLKHGIRRQERGVSDTCAKKLVFRMIDPLLERSGNHLAIRIRTERKNELQDTERRIPPAEKR